MNQAIVGGWGSRRSKISLNTAIPGGPPPGSAAAAALAAQQQKQSRRSEQEGGDSNSTGNNEGTEPNIAQGGGLESAQGTTAENGTTTPGISAPQSRQGSPNASGDSPSITTSSGKRKIRREGAVGTGSSSKRSRPAGSLRGGDVADKYTSPTTRLADLGGISNAIEKVLELIAMPLCHPEIYVHTGVKPPRGVLLHGPPGCGKTMLAGAIAGELSVPFLSISAPSIVSGTSGESEKTLRDTFDEAARVAPCILFIDEIDAITPKRETASREMERRIVAQLLTCLDDLSWEKTEGKSVMIIGATNRPDSLDPALRRAGRFDHEITLGVPDEAGREQILRVLSQKLRLSGDFDFAALAKATPGYVGADLTALTGAAGILAVKRIFQYFGHQFSTADHSVDSDVSSTNPSAPSFEAVEARSNSALDGLAPSDVEMTAVAHHPDAVTSIPTSSTDTSQAPREDDTAVTADGVSPQKAINHLETAGSVGGVRPSASFFEALPTALQASSIAKFLRQHPTPLSPAQLESLSITNADFLAALPSVQPSSKREGFATVPDVTWNDIGALHETRDELAMAIVEPIRRPELFRAVGVSASSGVLLWGPPGCGKTLLAKAVANESRANFISVKGPELLNKYVGESERAVRQVFSRARTSSPCVIFFDELDALVPRRDDALSESSSRVVNTLLTELDGLESRVQMYVIGATNRPDMIDPAMCRPGRLDKLLYVDLPSMAERFEILKTLTKDSPLRTTTTNDDPEGKDIVNLLAIANDLRAEGYSGADLASLTREAAVTALRQTLRSYRTDLTGSSVKESVSSSESPSSSTVIPHVTIRQVHFLQALDKITPSVSTAQRAKYHALRSRLSGLPAGTAKRSSAETDNSPQGMTPSAPAA